MQYRVRTVLRLSYRLAVEGHNAVDHPNNAGDLAPKAAFEQRRIQHPKHHAKCAMRRFAVGQIEEDPQPVFLDLAPVRDIDPAV